MVSIEFIYFFLPVFMGIYGVIPAKFRSGAIFMGTVLLGMWFAPIGLIPLLVSVLTAYFGGIIIAHSKKNIPKIILAVCVIINVMIFLLCFRAGYFKSIIPEKYSFFKVIGAAIFTFHSISYCGDIYQKKYLPEKSFLKIAAYVGFFPCLTAGPLLNYGDISEFLHNPEVTSEKLVKGINLFLMGLIEKFVFSVPLYQVQQQINLNDVSSLGTFAAWIGIICFAMGFYFEFASFFNMARGISSMLGLEIGENINRPFTSKTIAEFFKRFNSGLYLWLKNYIQKPLRNKCGKVFSFMVCIAATGLWYGISAQTFKFSLYVILLFSVDFAAFKIINKNKKAVKIKYVVMNILMLTGIPFLAVENTGNALKYIGIMFGAGESMAENSTFYLIKTCGLLFAVGMLVMSGAGKFFTKKINSINENFLTIARPVFEIFMLIIVTAFISGTPAEYLTFLY